MALDTFVAGAYDATYDATATGLAETGYEVNFTLKQEAIDKSDLYGDAILDYIYRGQDVDCQYTSKAYKAGSIAPLLGFTGALGVLASSTITMGRLASDLAKAFVLSAKSNTPAATAPASLTASKGILAPSFNWKLLFDSRLRQVPVKLQFLPYDATGTIRHFALT